MIAHSPFKIHAPFPPAGDQPQAIEALTQSVASGAMHQALVGVTGSGKTFTAANVIANTGKPTLVISHNKTLALQLYQEFKEFLPENSVHYFVSYYDYYQPEAYIPQTDTYIDKDVKINEMLDRLRHEAAQAVLTRRDVVVIASVSCIYNIGSPATFDQLSLALTEGQTIKQKELLRHLISLQYERNQIEKRPGTFQAKGDTVVVYPPTGNGAIRIVIAKDTIVDLSAADDIIQPAWQRTDRARLFPAKFWTAGKETLPLAMANIRAELADRLREFESTGKLLEAQRIKQRTEFDLEMLEAAGYCRGIENYSRQVEFREPGSPPYTLIDYFRHAYGKDFLVVIDESHMTIPQVRGMYYGDRARKESLINYGFRLPSALDNRPLQFHEFERLVPQALYLSATPADYELNASVRVVEQIVRPTGLLDPVISVRPTANQTENAIEEIAKRVKKGQRALVTVLTKRMAEDFADFLKEKGVNASYIHSEVKTLERQDILEELRRGKHDVLVGVNLLREGLDLPEVSLVIIMDADKEGFLRNKTTLIQTMGRAARHHEGAVIMYADTITKSMREAMLETERRRKIQESYNKERGLEPQQIQKPIRDKIASVLEKGTPDLAPDVPVGLLAQSHDIKKLIAAYTKEMKNAARVLDFQKAERLKEQIQKLKKHAQ